MALSTSIELKALVQDYLAQDDVSAVVDDLVSLAESKFQREIRTRQMHALEPAQFIPAGGVVALPSDFLEIIAHSITADPPITPSYVPPNQFISLAVQSGSGYPRVYTMIGDDIHFAPVPDATSTYSYVLYYLQKIPSLNDETTNWLLDTAPDVYLYGVLLEAEPYLVNDPRIATWAQLYENAKTSLMKLDARSRHRPDASMRSYKAGKYEGYRGTY